MAQLLAVQAVSPYGSALASPGGDSPLWVRGTVIGFMYRDASMPQASTKLLLVLDQVLIAVWLVSGE